MESGHATVITILAKLLKVVPTKDLTDLLMAKNSTGAPALLLPFDESIASSLMAREDLAALSVAQENLADAVTAYIPLLKLLSPEQRHELLQTQNQAGRNLLTLDKQDFVPLIRQAHQALVTALSN